MSLFPRAISWPIATSGQGEWRWQDPPRWNGASCAPISCARWRGRRDRDPAGRLAGAARAASAGRGGQHAGRNGRRPRRAQDRRTRSAGGGAAGALDRPVRASHELRRHRHAGFSRVRGGGRGRVPLGAAPRLQAHRSAERAWRQRERAAHHHRRTDAEARRADRAVHLLVRGRGGDRQRSWRRRAH